MIAVAYQHYRHRLRDSADHLGPHYATVSQRLKQAERAIWDYKTYSAAGGIS